MKKNVKKSSMGESAIVHGHFYPKMMYNFSLQFSLYFGENFLIGQERKYMDPTIYFSFSLPNQTHSKKIFFPFSLQCFPFTLFHLQTNTPFDTVFRYCFLDFSFKILLCGFFHRKKVYFLIK